MIGAAARSVLRADYSEYVAGADEMARTHNLSQVP
eukprot:SAG11_NODE_16291_length_552_cov_0.569536_1_plen_34_part_01